MPNVRVAIFSGALGIEAVRLGDTTRLVVTADEMDSVWVAELQADQK